MFDIKTITLGFCCGYQDQFLIDHFVRYYTNLGVHNIVCGLGYWVGDWDENAEHKFNDFASDMQKKYQNILLFDVVGKINSDGLQKKSLYNKISELKQDYVIIADSDEFHEYPFDLQSTIQFMIENNYDYLNGHTVERISADGSIINVDANKDIFEQFPNSGLRSFIQPKISITKNEYFKYVGVGHHGIDSKYKLIGKNCTKTHHFRWSLEGKKRAEALHKAHTSATWIAWKSLDYSTKRLEAFNHNLSTYPD